MFSVMISIPLLNYDTYFTDLTAYDTGLIYLENTYTHKEINISSTYNESYNVYIQVAKKIDGINVLFLGIDDYAQINKSS